MFMIIHKHSFRSISSCDDPSQSQPRFLRHTSVIFDCTIRDRMLINPFFTKLFHHTQCYLITSLNLLFKNLKPKEMNGTVHYVWKKMSSLILTNEKFELSIYVYI